MFHQLHYPAKHVLDQFDVVEDVLIHLKDKLNNVACHSMAKFEVYHYHKQLFVVLLLHRMINAEELIMVEDKELLK
jgi:hypothetical protein